MDLGRTGVCLSLQEESKHPLAGVTALPRLALSGARRRQGVQYRQQSYAVEDRYKYAVEEPVH